MYCPRCAVENLDEASFCRLCGADISLVPQALTGHLPVETKSGNAARSKNSLVTKEKRIPTLEQAFSNIFIGVGFLLWFFIGATAFRGAFPFWFWAIFPGFACLGSGIGQYIANRKEERREQFAQATPPVAFLPPLARPVNMEDAPPARHVSLPAPDTSEIVNLYERAPVSVTEGTTRLLDDAGESRPRTRRASLDHTDAAS